ncbi:MAG: hypothetical protein WA397_26950 [Roseiarcus sp.]
MPEKRLDADEDFGDDLAKRRIMGRNIERRVHKHAPFPVAIVERALYDVLKERPDRWRGGNSSQRRILSAMLAST